MDRNSDDPRVAEYELLKEEILQFDRLVVQVLGFMFPVIGLILAHGITTESPYVFLVPLPILLAVNLYVTDKRWGTWLIATYLKLYCESPDGFRWET